MTEIYNVCLVFIFFMINRCMRYHPEWFVREEHIHLAGHNNHSDEDNE